MTGAAVLIPAYRPAAALPELVAELVNRGITVIVVVDDGSEPQYRAIFETLAEISQVEVLRHAVNLGKGAALKTGMNWLLTKFPQLPGVVTADADGQHHPDDILAVAQRFAAEPNKLVLGARSFAGTIPLRSRFGNELTRRVMRLVLGNRLTDTQTGLRAVPRALMLRLLRIPAAGYEFELEMLIAAKHLGVSVTEQPVRTIYQPGNPTSHFQPLRDSMRIYFVLLRFGLISALTALLDNVLFWLVFHATANIAQAQAAGRIAAALFNYAAVRRAVFFSDEKHKIVLPRYLLLVSANALASYVGIRFITSQWSVGVVPAKLMAETLLFIANFAIQRDFVFTKRPATPRATDWDRYYQSVPRAARLTRRYTTSVLIRALRRFGKERAVILEIGGANSCFLGTIQASLAPVAYHVADLNRYGLSLLKDRKDVVLHEADVLSLGNLGVTADAVFSVGLIEHFHPADTKKAILAHFGPLKPGGIAIISYPTPTWLYRAARATFETLGLWHFPDERPLQREEVAATAESVGTILFEKTLWPLILTQHLLVVRKN